MIRASEKGVNNAIAKGRAQDRVVGGGWFNPAACGFLVRCHPALVFDSASHYSRDRRSHEGGGPRSHALGLGAPEQSRPGRAAYIKRETERAGGTPSEQPYPMEGNTYRNVIGAFGPDTKERIVVVSKGETPPYRDRRHFRTFALRHQL